MTIKYLKKLQANPVVWVDDDDDENYEIELVSCTIEEIESLENRVSKKFPQAYREYLFLAGKDNPFFGNAGDFSYDELESIQINCKDYLQELNMSLGNDFWVIDSYLAEQFHFFYFDDSENPQVFHFCDDCTEKEGYLNGISKSSKSLSSFIEGSINSRFSKKIIIIIQHFFMVLFKIKYYLRRK